MNYHWDKARQKAAKTLERLPNDQEFILVLSAGVIAWAQSRNYMQASEGLLRYVMSSINVKDPRYQLMIEKMKEAVVKMGEVKAEMKRLESPIVDASGHAMASPIVQPENEQPSNEDPQSKSAPSEEQKN